MIRPILKSRTSVAPYLLLALLCCSQVSFAQEVQRLFSTPLQRAQLDRLRTMANDPASIDVPIGLPIEIPFLAEPEIIEDTIYALGGTMRRSDGSFTVWLNGAAVDQNELPEFMELLLPYSQGQVQIFNEETGQLHRVKPGQVLNYTSGELLESYQLVPEPVELVISSAVTESNAAPTTNELVQEAADLVSQD